VPMSSPADAAPGPLRRCGVSQVTTLPWTFAEDVAAYAAGGWGGIGVWLQKLTLERSHELRFPPSARIAPEVIETAGARLRDSGLSVTHLVCGALFTDPDPVQRRARVEHAVFAAETASRLGASCLVVIPGPSYGQSHARALEAAKAGLVEILERTPDLEMPIAIEPVLDVDFIDTLASALDLVEAVDHPRLGVYLDSLHLWEEPDIHDQIRRARGRILGVHVADASPHSEDRQRQVPGDGVIPLGEFLTTVGQTGYAGTYDVETLGDNVWADPAMTLRRSAIAMAEFLEIIS
jgi:sugar phosphate isomerase/epimerase